jgi:hypothetical protein
MKCKCIKNFNHATHSTFIQTGEVYNVIKVERDPSTGFLSSSHFINKYITPDIRHNTIILFYDGKAIAPYKDKNYGWWFTFQDYFIPIQRIVTKQPL